MTEGYDALTGLGMEERVGIVERSMELYDKKLDRDKIESLSGRHRTAIEEAVDTTVEWGRDIEKYMEKVLGTNYRGEEQKSGEPVFVILPRNDRGDLAPYVLSQCFLAGTPSTVRPSSREASLYVTETYIESLQEAVSEEFGEAIDVFDLLEPQNNGDRRERIADAFTDGGRIVLFGRNSTVDAIEASIYDANKEVKDTVRMGTGQSSSILFDVEEEHLEKYCEEIVASAIFDKGDDCTSTNVLYVVGEEGVYEDAIEVITNIADDIAPGKDFAIPADEEFEDAVNLARLEHPGATLSQERLNIIECLSSSPVSEYPIPLIQIKSVPDTERLLEIMEEDVDDKVLTTAIYTDRDSIDELKEDIPAHLVKQNQPTHDIDLFEPHQGMYLVEELLLTEGS